MGRSACGSNGWLVFIQRLHTNLVLTVVGIGGSSALRDKVAMYCQSVTYSKYQVADCYSSLCGDAEKLRWPRMVWHRYVVPKHRFISWLAILGGLKTKDMMQQ